MAAQCKMRIDELFRIVGLDQPKNPVCDFCGGRDPLVRYMVEDRTSSRQVSENYMADSGKRGKNVDPHRPS